MNKSIKILIAAILVAVVFKRDQICEHLGFGQAMQHDASTAILHKKKLTTSDDNLEGDYYINDTIYRWDELLLDWVIAEDSLNIRPQKANDTASHDSLSRPIEIDWKVLMDIQYRLRYFSKIDMEMYAPVFTQAVEALHQKEVIIKGFVIPFYEDIISLSFNPFSSCFFCGKASPASVMSLYLKDGYKSYKLDDVKKFKGILQLNQDDPAEFYYILQNAEVVKM